jgi:hypothetical protein
VTFVSHGIFALFVWANTHKKLRLSFISEVNFSGPDLAQLKIGNNVLRTKEGTIMKTTYFILASVIAFSLSGCQTDAKATGQAVYGRPASEGGKPVSRQKKGDLQLTVNFEGEAVWDLVSGVACSLTSGGAEGSVQAEGKARSDGSYVTTFATAEGSFDAQNDILCSDLQGVQFDTLVNVQITGSLPANEDNCNEFCQASAEADCEGNADEAGCIIDAKASCDTDCANSTSIKGSGQISADALTSLNDGLSANGKIEADVELVFDSLE